MSNLTFPVLRVIAKTVHPMQVSQYEFTRNKPYLLVGIESPEVAKQFTDRVFIANATPYERAVAEYLGSDYQYDKLKFMQAELRTIFYLNELAGTVAETAPEYTLVLHILEFTEN